MDDTVQAMRRGLVAMLAVAACGGDPSLVVSVDHPAGSGVDHTAITVYESATASCTDIEFAVFDEAQLGALAVAELVIDIDGKTMAGALAGISRTDKKLIVARGFDAANVLLTAGCVEHLEVFEGDVAEVITVPVAAVSLGALNPGNESKVRITLTAPSGASIANRRVAWRVFGPSGTTPVIQQNVALVDGEPATWEPAAPACTDVDGGLDLRPVPPLQTGGFAFDIRASWAAEPPQLFSSFTRVAMGLHNFTPAVLSNRRWCVIRSTATEQDLVCLEQQGPNVVAVKHAITVSNGAPVFGTPQTQPFAANPIGLVSADRGDGIRDVYAVTARGQVSSVFSPSVPINIATPPFVTDIEDLIALPKCGGQTPKLLVALRTVTPGVRTVDGIDLVSGAKIGNLGIADDSSLEFNNAGCVTELDPNPQGTPVLRQVVVVDVGRSGGARTTAHFDCGAGGGRCNFVLPVPRAGVGFTNDDERRMITAFFDASGVVLISGVLLPDANKQDRLVQRERTAVAAFPQRIASGIVDFDSESDFVVTIFNGAQDSTNLQIAYARPVGGDRLTALSGQQPLVANELLVADVTRDGHADLILTGAADLMGTSPGVAVIPSHVVIPAGTVSPDTPCGN